MASSKETYCLCGQPYNIGQFMIECDCCREWFHGSCVNVKIYHSDDIDKYHCPKCSTTYGPSVLKLPTNNHRGDRYEIGAETRPSQVGSPAWIRALAARPLRPVPAALHRMRAEQFTEEYVRDNEFTRPIIFHAADGLDIRVPNQATFTVRSVLRYCGSQLEVEVIDVRKQSTMRMSLGDFVDYFETPPEHRDEKVLNVLSLEFSDTNLSPHVEPPAVVRRLDWANRVWPTSEERPPRPTVQKYCLMSAAGSYTDFHVDFGGTTVWYHVLHGRKIFYLIPPTATNLALYQQWSASNNQNEKFFGDLVEWYGSVELVAGETLFIPSGWIHAVLTPCDSLVFGGNLLHSYAIEMQLQIYEIERRVETPLMLRYPLFESMHWYAGVHLLTMLRRHNEETQDEDFTLSDHYSQSSPAELPPLLLRGIKILANALKEWHALKSSDTVKRENVPKCLNSGQLVRELAKELRSLEKRTLSTTHKDKEKVKSHISPKTKKNSASKKPLKLTLPKPIMHMVPNGEYPEEKVYADKFFIDNKEVFPDNRYMAQDVKFNVNNVVQEQKFIDRKEPILQEKCYVYQSFEEHAPTYQDGNGFMDSKKNILKIKSINPTSSQETPPPYSLPEHSILKSHLIRSDRPTLKPIHQWTISKKDIGDYQDEQILLTNENLQTNNVRIDTQELNYGPGMYSAEDMQPDYQYAEPAKIQYNQYYPNPSQQYVTKRYEELQLPQQTTYAEIPTEQASITNGYQLPSYDAAIAQQYANNFQVVEEKPPVTPSPSTTPTPVRRSERPSRRRLSNTYDYEDGDLFIDDAPTQPSNSKRSRHKQSSASQSNFRSSNVNPVPANGIESLIQASVLADTALNGATEDVAVEGMLSIGEQRFTSPQRTFGLATPTKVHSTSSHENTPSSSKRTPKQITPKSQEEFIEEEDIIKEVHSDDEYVYPSLEMTSDEDEEWMASNKKRRNRSRLDRSKADKDESWSPRARLGRLVPRTGGGRPVRRRESVRAALHHAAQQHHHQQQQQQQQLQQRTKAQQNAKRAVIATKSRRPPPPVQSPSSNKNNLRLKKGMKTAKQRLGKILKIHKMIY